MPALRTNINNSTVNHAEEHTNHLQLIKNQLSGSGDSSKINNVIQDSLQLQIEMLKLQLKQQEATKPAQSYGTIPVQGEKTVDVRKWELSNKNIKCLTGKLIDENGYYATDANEGNKQEEKHLQELITSIMANTLRGPATNSARKWSFKQKQGSNIIAMDYKHSYLTFGNELGHVIIETDQQAIYQEEKRRLESSLRSILGL